MQRARARTFCLAARSSNRSIAEEAACAEPALSSAAAPAAKPESTWGRRAGVGVEGRAALAGGLRRARARAAAGLAAVLQRWRRRPGRARARSPRGATPQRRGPPRRTCDGRGGPDARSMGGIWSRARARCGRGCGRSSACCAEPSGLPTAGHRGARGHGAPAGRGDAYSVRQSGRWRGTLARATGASPRFGPCSLEGHLCDAVEVGDRWVEAAACEVRAPAAGAALKIAAASRVPTRSPPPPPPHAIDCGAPLASGRRRRYTARLICSYAQPAAACCARMCRAGLLCACAAQALSVRLLLLRNSFWGSHCTNTVALRPWLPRC